LKQLVCFIKLYLPFKERRHDIVEAFCEDSVLRSTLQEDFLKGIPDLDRIIRKFQRLKASLKDCVMLYQFTTRLEQLQKALDEYDGQHKSLIQEYITLVEVCKIQLSFISKSNFEMTFLIMRQ
jgi:DNA mismatch repair ATPase MutS